MSEKSQLLIICNGLAIHQGLSKGEICQTLGKHGPSDIFSLSPDQSRRLSEFLKTRSQEGEIVAGESFGVENGCRLIVVGVAVLGISWRQLLREIADQARISIFECNQPQVDVLYEFLCAWQPSQEISDLSLQPNISAAN